jgi:uncharacterized membrane protein
MKVLPSLIILIVFISLVSPVFSQEISYDFTIILSGTTAHETIQIELNNTGDHTIEEFSYELPTGANDILVYDSIGNLTLDVSESNPLIIRSDFRSPIEPGSSGVVNIQFTSSELVSTLGDEFIFSALFSPPQFNTEKFQLKVILPKGMGLSTPISSGAQTDIAPIPDDVISDGTTTSFLWKVEPDGEFAVFIRYKPLISQEVPQSPEEQFISLNYLIPILLILIFIGVLIFYILKLRTRSVKDRTEFMDDDKRIIIELVRENEGIVQKRLVDQTGFSKAKISNIVSELKRRNILRVERIGRRNKLFLTEEFK